MFLIKQGEKCSRIQKKSNGGSHIRYISLVYCIPWWFYIIIVGIGCAVWTRNNKWSNVFVVCYVTLIIAQTVLFRESTETTRYNLQLFWSYKVFFSSYLSFEDKMFIYQILFNIAMFIPIGLVMGFEKRLKAIVWAIVFSLCIESLQLVMHKGLYELDDILHNTIGGIIGTCIALGIKQAMRIRDRHLHAIVKSEKESKHA